MHNWSDEQKQHEIYGSRLKKEVKRKKNNKPNAYDWHAVDPTRTNSILTSCKIYFANDFFFFGTTEMEHWEYFDFSLSLLKLDKFVRFIVWSYEQSWNEKLSEETSKRLKRNSNETRLFARSLFLHSERSFSFSMEKTQSFSRPWANVLSFSH